MLVKWPKKVDKNAEASIQSCDLGKGIEVVFNTLISYK